MNDLIKLLTSQEIIIVYIVAAVACFLYFIIYLIDKSYHKRRQKQNTRELNRLVEDINAHIAEETKNLEPVTIEEEKKEPFVYVEPVLVKEEVPAITPVEQTIQVEPIVTQEEKIEEVKEVEKTEPVIIEKTEEEEVTSSIEELVLDSMESTPEPEITYTAIEPNPEQAQEELRKLTEELEK